MHTAYECGPLKAASVTNSCKAATVISQRAAAFRHAMDEQKLKRPLANRPLDETRTDAKHQ